MLPAAAPRERVSAGVMLCAALLAGCGGVRTFVRPVGPGAPAPDAAAAWDEATRTCRAVETYTGALALTGQIGAQRIRGLASATLDVAIDRGDRLALESRVAGQVVVRLGGTESAAVLWLRDGNRVARASAMELLRALVGTPFPPARLREVLAGCPGQSAAPSPAVRYGQIIQFGGDRAGQVFVASVNGRWHVRAWAFDGWTVTYEQDPEQMPRRLVVSSDPGTTPAVTLSLRVTHVETNVEVPPGVFTVAVPRGAREMSVDELRAAGPLGDDERKGVE